MPMTRNKPPQYKSYMLRCWEIRSQGPDRPATWGFSLQDSQTGQQRAFPDLEALVTFVRAELETDTFGQHKLLE
jgi:hypothetical protein